MTRRLLLLACWLTMPALVIAQEQKLAIEDLYRFDQPRTPVLSPDGKRLAYVRHWFDSKKQERHSLWLVEGAGTQPRALEPDEPDARAPVFSPDGKWIAFLSTRSVPARLAAPPESDPVTDIWVIPTAGGKAVPLAGKARPYGRVFHDGFYGGLAFSPDGKRLAFIADDGRDPRTAEEIAADVIVVRPDQGEGYTGYGPAQLWVAHLDAAPGRFAAAKIERLTDDDVWYGDPQWAPAGHSLVVHANRTADRESVRYSINKNFDLWQIDAQTRQVRRLTSGPGPEVSPRFAPDGKRLVCLSIPRQGTHRDVFNLAVVTLDPGEPKTTVLFNHHQADAGPPPHLPPTFPLPADCWDGPDHVVYQAAAGTETATVRLHVPSAKGEPLPKSPPSADSHAGRSTLRRQMTPPGNAFLRQRKLGETRLVRWKNEGFDLEGVLTLPPEGQAPYPLLLNPHGGPHSRSTRGFHFLAQVCAAHGYAVFQPNFRGSEGYGQKFIDADRGDFGGGDMRDILAGIDQLIREGVIDRDRQFVFGSSYGGFMTCWLVGHTQQFRAAVAQNPVTDLAMMWGLSDLPSWVEWEFGGRPWEIPDVVRRHSPLTRVAQVRTPTLILQSREDRRCPLPMAQMFYRALLARSVPTEMVIYPGEGHGIRQPRHQEDALRRLLAWFEKHGRR